MVIAFFVFVESITRLLDPPNINTDMLTVSMEPWNRCFQLLTDIQSRTLVPNFMFFNELLSCAAGVRWRLTGQPGGYMCL